MILEGIQLNETNKYLELSEKLIYQLTKCSISWNLKSKLLLNTSKSIPTQENNIYIPVYLTNQRLVLINQILVKISNDISKDVWIQRGVAIILQNNH